MYAPDINPAKVHPHSISVFFMVLCIGSTFDTTHPDHEIHTERFHALARAALSSHSIVHWRTCATIQALLLLNLYKYIAPRPSPEYMWLMSGICGRYVRRVPISIPTECRNRVAQAMGLRECSRVRKLDQL
jgi:hypothetical protein